VMAAADDGFAAMVRGTHSMTARAVFLIMMKSSLFVCFDFLVPGGT
jgi:hypothetical protein